MYSNKLSACIIHELYSSPKKLTTTQLSIRKTNVNFHSFVPRSTYPYTQITNSVIYSIFNRTACYKFSRMSTPKKREKQPVAPLHIKEEDFLCKVKERFFIQAMECDGLLYLITRDSIKTLNETTFSWGVELRPYVCCAIFFIEDSEKSEG